jgi:15-cis-phytoene desaturase
MARQNVPERVKDEVFVAMAKALNFIDPEELSMTVILTALNRFLREKGGSRVAFLDGPPTTRLCIPLAERIVSNGGQVLTNKRLQKIRVSDTNGAVEALELGGGETVKADAYVSALPVDILKTKLPEEWTHAHSYFSDMQQLEGVPVINVHLWFDRKLCNIDNLLFSRSKLLSVYADMSTCCRAYENNERSMLELVFAPAGSFIGKPDVEIVAATMGELEKLFPNELGSENGAQLVKAHVVQTARSVYTAVKGTGALRPTQVSPIRNFFLAGCFTRQKYLASMEGAVLSGKLAAQAVLESQEERKGLGYSR